MPIDIVTPYLLFLGGTKNFLDAKTARGIQEWRPELCTGQWRLGVDTVDLGLPDLDPQAALAAGARTLVIGVAPVGGQIAAEWIAPICHALAAGLDVAAGLHQRLEAVPAIAEAARIHGRRLHNVRHADVQPPVATGIRRPGRRLLTVGTDCAIGKKFTALAIHREMQQRGIASRFCATGQTGILIAGTGLAIDAVVADFAAGAAEAISPATPPDEWSVIEGQGSLFHPAYAGVSLALLHGSQPDAIVVCHQPGRAEIDDFPGFALPSLTTCIARNLEAARLTNAAARCVGVALDTSRLDASARAAALAAAERETGVPAADPLIHGTGAFIDALMAL